MANIIHSICVAVFALSAGCMASPVEPTSLAAGDAGDIDLPVAHSASDSALVVEPDEETIEPTAHVNKRQVALCAAAIYVAVYGVVSPTAKLVKFVRGVGGVRWAAKMLVRATTRSEKVRVIESVVRGGAIEILGIKEIADNC